MSSERHDLYLSYSGRKVFLTCPKQYYFKYILKDTSKSDPKNTMFGSAIGKIFEWFYDQKMWADPDPVSTALSKIEEATLDTFQKEGYSRGSDPSYETKFRSDMESFIPSGIDIIRNNGFLSPNSRVEEDLTVTYSPPSAHIRLKMVGRADFIHSKNPHDVWILDGKASKHREKYVDSSQLIWYATQHYLKYHVAPTRIGFIFWCFPDSPVKWVDYDNDSMRDLIKKTVDVAERILSKDFVPTPSGECHRCPYRSKCDEGNIYLANRRVESGGRIDLTTFDIEKV